MSVVGGPREAIMEIARLLGVADDERRAKLTPEALAAEDAIRNAHFDALMEATWAEIARRDQAKAEK